jgi:hypothetical protein
MREGVFNQIRENLAENNIFLIVPQMLQIVQGKLCWFSPTFETSSQLIDHVQDSVVKSS